MLTIANKVSTPERTNHLYTAVFSQRSTLFFCLILSYLAAGQAVLHPVLICVWYHSDIVLGIMSFIPSLKSTQQEAIRVQRSKSTSYECMLQSARLHLVNRCRVDRFGYIDNNVVAEAKCEQASHSDWSSMASPPGASK